METESTIRLIVQFLEFLGILVVTYGSIKAAVQLAINIFQKTKIVPDLRRTLAFGLEFLMAAEIIRSVIVRTMNELVMLGGIIALRGLLGLIIHWEEKTP